MKLEVGRGNDYLGEKSSNERNTVSNCVKRTKRSARPFVITQPIEHKSPASIDRERTSY